MWCVGHSATAWRSSDASLLKRDRNRDVAAIVHICKGRGSRREHGETQGLRPLGSSLHESLHAQLRLTVRGQEGLGLVAMQDCRRVQARVCNRRSDRVEREERGSASDHITRKRLRHLVGAKVAIAEALGIVRLANSRRAVLELSVSIYGGG